MDSLARLISIVFHPLLMTTYLFALLAWLMPSALYPVGLDSIWSFVALIFFMTGLLPALNVVFFKMFGAISSLRMEDRRERLMPALIIALLYGVVTYMFHSRLRFGLTDSVIRLFLVVDLLVTIGLLITTFFKISMHALAIWGITGILFALTGGQRETPLFYAVVWLVLTSGLVMSSRLHLQAHNLREVMTGAGVGAGCSYAAMLLLS